MSKKRTRRQRKNTRRAGTQRRRCEREAEEELLLGIRVRPFKMSPFWGAQPSPTALVGGDTLVNTVAVSVS